MLRGKRLSPYSNNGQKILSGTRKKNTFQSEEISIVFQTCWLYNAVHALLEVAFYRAAEQSL